MVYTKGGDSLQPSQYRPITIPSNLLRLVTVRVSQRMADIVEKNGMLGEEQFGFRRKRSTLDAIFVLTRLLQKAKRRRQPYAAAFIDISKAYDKVWRPKLFEKLKKLGFGGKILKLIQSMYKNDSISLVINGKYTVPLFLTLGVKQGKIIKKEIIIHL